MYAQPRFLIAGDSGLVVEFGNRVSPEINLKVRRLLLYLDEHPPKGMREAVPTYRSLLIDYDPLASSLEMMRIEIEKAVAESGGISLYGARRITVPVKYGEEYGPDLGDVAAYNKITEEDVVRIHSGTDYLVYMIGFTPGFPYLGEVSQSIVCPRLATPRVKVPAGSVGIAGTLTGIYPVESPGGWRLIGRTAVKLFSERMDPPSVLRAGDYVRFLSITEAEYKRMVNQIETARYELEVYPPGKQ
jgi:inhibitor of KinA